MSASRGRSTRQGAPPLLWTPLSPVSSRRGRGSCGMRTSPSLPAPDLPEVGAEDIAVVQFTSGSTAEPKAALISHRAVAAQRRALESYMRAGDVAVGWAPFFHDLGLISYVIWGVLDPTPAEVLATEDFARDPSAWLTLIQQANATMSLGPQSAWTAAFRAARRRALKVDLRCLEIGWFAAEPIDPLWIDKLPELDKEYGLRREAVGATYGLAEAVLGVTSTPRGQGIGVEAFDPEELAKGVAVPQAEGKRFVSSGRLLDGMAVRIAVEGKDVGSSRIGDIEVSGASLLSGYLGGAPSPVRDGWLCTGDEGFLHDGELYVTGRTKDLVIAMGVKYHPEDFEWAANRIDSLRPGRSVAFSDTAGERIVLICEPTDYAEPELAGLVRRAIGDAVGKAPDVVLLVPSGTVEKTTSGSSAGRRCASGTSPGPFPANAIEGTWATGRG